MLLFLVYMLDKMAAWLPFFSVLTIRIHIIHICSMISSLTGNHAHLQRPYVMSWDFPLLYSACAHFSYCQKGYNIPLHDAFL